MTGFIFTDLNVRLNDVNPNDIVVITDSQAIKQAIEKLINTPLGSIPYYRAYGVDIKQFMHYPLSEDTGKEAYDHIKGQINKFIQMVTVLEDMSTVIIDYDNETISIQIVVQSNNTGEVITLSPVTIPVTN
jgi:phage baseplate assembly protein W